MTDQPVADEGSVGDPSAPSDPLDRVLDRHDAAAARHNTGRMARRGAKALGAANLASQLTRILATIALARLLGPEVFGLVALVTVVTGFFERFLGDTGTAAAVVQHKELTQRLASSVFWFNVSLGGITSLAFIALGSLVASLLGEPAVAPYVRALGLTALINSFSYVQQSMLRRHGRFGPLAIGRYANVAVTSGLSIILALIGWEVWALIAGTLAGSASWVIILWAASTWRPALHLARSDLQQIRRLSTNITAFNFFGYFVSAGDRLIVGRFLGPVALGYYGMSNRLLRYPVQSGLQPYREVVLPMLSKLQDDPKTMGRVYIRTVSALAFVLTPITVGVAVMADPLVRTVLGTQWEAAIPVISIIAIVATLQAMTTTTGSLFVVMDRSDLWLRWGILSAVITLACYGVGLRWGIEGVALGYLFAIVALTYPSFRIPFGLIGYEVSDLARAVGPTMVAAAVMGGAAYAAGELVVAAGATTAVELVCGIIVGVLVYAAWAITTRPQAFQDVLSLAKRDRDAFLA